LHTHHLLKALLTIFFLFVTATPGFALEESVRQEIQEEATRERESEASEDPLITRQTEKTDNPVLHEIMPDRFTLYGSLRIRHRHTDGASIFGDGGSRVGMEDHFQFKPNYWLLGRLEVGFNLLDNLDLIFDPGGQGEGTFGEDMFERLAYVGLETPKTFFLYGKNWSTYYQVASFTDRFQGAGAGASGTFNAGTDGGPSGTGRADQVFQTRIQIDHPWGPFSTYKPFSLNVQFQPGEKIPHARDFRYEYGLGGSAILERTDNIKIGIAANYSHISPDALKVLRFIGIDNDDLAILLGAQWFGEKYYIASTLSWLTNHMATEDGIYFDAWGSELYGHYQLTDRVWFVGGWNYLTPLSGEHQAGDYTLQYVILGLRYTFKEFKQMVYANIRFDRSKLYSTKSEGVGNVYTIGLRWDFDWNPL